MKYQHTSLFVDMENIESIKNTEALKLKLEYNGFNLIKTTQTGLNVFRLDYRKEVG